jgi:RNA polymerase sigma factor (sigma-70 family)
VTTPRETTTEAATANAGPEPSRAGRPHPGRPARLLAELFDKYAPLVLGTCRGMLRDRHEAEDAAQQTFLSAYAALLSGTVPREPAAWLATIARNECRTRIEERMRRPLPVADAYAKTSDPADEAARAADVESLRRALAELPRQQRRAFVLREFSGLSYDELAVALGVSGPAIESLLFRARRRLRVSLRAAAAAASSLPAGIRDLFAQLAAGPSDAPATVAKLGSAPLLAKLAGVGAGAAFLTAGATSVLPVRHHAPRHVGPARAAVGDATRRRPIVRPTPVPKAFAVATTHESRHEELARRLEPEPAAHEGRDSGGRSAAPQAPEPQTPEPVDNAGPGSEPSTTETTHVDGEMSSGASISGSDDLGGSGESGGVSQGTD